jgi:hypothetical protein
MTVQHKELAAGRWAKMPLAEQMANIGSEVERAISWRSKKNADYARMAFERALELIDLTLDSTAKASSLKEIARVREAVVDYFAGDNLFMSTDKSWRDYFLHFAYAARRDR